MKRPKQKQSRSKYDREKLSHVICKVDSDDNNEDDGSSSEETEDCSDDSNVSDDRDMFCEDCKPRKSKKSSISSHSGCSSDSEISSRHKKKGFSMIVVATDKTDYDSGSDLSDRIVRRNDKKKRNKSNDVSGGEGSRKKSKDSKKHGSLKIKKITTDSCEDISRPMKILHRFISQGCEKSEMKDRKSKQSLGSKEREPLELDSEDDFETGNSRKEEDDCERGHSRRDKKHKRESSVPPKESRKESSSKKKRSLSRSNDNSGKKTSTKCCQTMSIEFVYKPKNSKYDNKKRSKSCQTPNRNSAVYSFTEIKKPTGFFMPPNQTLPIKCQTDCSEYLPPTRQMDCPENIDQDTGVKDSQKPAADRTINTLELHVDLGGSYKNHNSSKEIEKETKPQIEKETEPQIETKPRSEENMKWCEKAFQDEFNNLVKKCEEMKPETLPTKGSSNKKRKSKSRSKSQRKRGIEKEASIVLNAADLSVLAKMMNKLSDPNC